MLRVTVTLLAYCASAQMEMEQIPLDQISSLVQFVIRTCAPELQ